MIDNGAGKDYNEFRLLRLHGVIRFLLQNAENLLKRGTVMRKTLSILLLAVLLVTLAVPVFAKENQNQVVKVESLSEGAQESSVIGMYHLKGKKLVDAATECEEELPKGVEAERLTMIRQRSITGDTFPIEISFRTWGAERDLLVFFQKEGEEGWELVASDKGNSVSASFACNGQYALVWSW